MNRYTITIHGGRDGKLRIGASALRDLLDALIDGARQATRFAVEGVSVRPGARPAWLDSLCKIDVTNLRGGSTILEHEAPTLAEAAPVEFQSDEPLFESLRLDSPTPEVEPSWSAIDYFGCTLAAAATGDRDKVRADRSLLDACIVFLKSAQRSVTLEGLVSHKKPLKLEPDTIALIEQLRDAIPAPRAVRLAGTLDTISASRQNIVLQLATGERVGVWLFMHDPKQLKQLFQQRVVVAGTGHFRPNGKLRLIEAQTLDPAREADKLFEKLPVPLESRSIVTPQPQDQSSGVAAFFGTWEGDETDEEILADLRAME